MNYIDGAVFAVPTAAKDAFREHANRLAKVFKDYGALQVVDCWGDDVPEGKVTSFPMAVKLQENETVCFSWITWPSRDARNDAWEKIMADGRMGPDDMPFDGKRMIFGSFEIISSA